MTFQEVINSDRPTLVDFSAEWCGPCKMMKPILEDLKEKMGKGANIIKVDVDRNPHAAKNYQIQSVPTLAIFKGGKMLWRQAGVIQSEALRKVLERYK